MLFGGLSVSGDAEYGGLRVTPRVGAHLTYATASDAAVTASTPNRRDTANLSLDDQQGVRFIAELGLLIGEGNIDDEQRNKFEQLTMIPRLYCDMAIGSNSDMACGVGINVDYRVTDPQIAKSWGLNFDAETNGRINRASVGLFHEQQVYRNGTLRFGTEWGLNRSTGVSSELNFEW